MVMESAKHGLHSGRWLTNLKLPEAGHRELQVTSHIARIWLYSSRHNFELDDFQKLALRSEYINMPVADLV